MGPAGRPPTRTGCQLLDIELVKWLWCSLFLLGILFLQVGGDLSSDFGGGGVKLERGEEEECFFKWDSPFEKCDIRPCWGVRRILDVVGLPLTNEHSSATSNLAGVSKGPGDAKQRRIMLLHSKRQCRLVVEIDNMKIMCRRSCKMIDTSLIECFGTMSRIKYWICDQDGRVHQRFNSERRLCKRSKLPPTLLQTGGFSFHTKFPWKLRRTNSCDVPEALLSGWHPSSHSFRLLLLYIFLPPKDVSFSFSFILFFPSLSRRGSHLCMGHLSLTKHFPLKSSRSPWSKTSPTCQVH